MIWKWSIYINIIRIRGKGITPEDYKEILEEAGKLKVDTTITEFYIEDFAKKYKITLNSGYTDIIISSMLRGVKYREMISVKGGTFIQESDEGKSFLHTISDFHIGKYEVTYELWYKVYQWALKNGYHFASAGMEGSVTGGGDWPNFNNVGKNPTGSKYHPVTMVNWRDCIVWCNAYSEMCGFSPVYFHNSLLLRDSRDSNGTSCDNATMNINDNGYRLPTEGEWQYAASYKDGNSFTPWNWASGASADVRDSRACDEVGWYWGDSGRSTHSVGELKANALGLYDMSGNVWEWCWDLYGSYPSSSMDDYTGLSTGSSRVVRGGSWSGNSKLLQVGYRSNDYPVDGSNYFGFRLARAF